MSDSDESQLIEVNRKLGILNNLVAFQIAGNMTITDGAPILNRLGLSIPEIAIIYDTSSKTVTNRLSDARKKSKK
jgi:hypothetical protein